MAAANTVVNSRLDQLEKQMAAAWERIEEQGKMIHTSQLSIERTLANMDGMREYMGLRWGGVEKDIAECRKFQDTIKDKVDENSNFRIKVIAWSAGAVIIATFISQLIGPWILSHV